MPLPKTRTKVALVPSRGLGDAIIFLQAANGFEEKGCIVSLFHTAIKTLCKKAPSISFFPRENIYSKLLDYDLVFIQYDDSKETKKLLSLRDTHPNFYVFYPSHKEAKHGPLQAKDFVCDKGQSMVKNLKKSLSLFFQINSYQKSSLSMESKVHKKYSKRIVIHCLSSEPKRQWPLKKYLLLEKKLQKLGYEPVFVMTENERKGFSPKEKALSLPSLYHLADYLYESGGFIGNESGPSHLASLLNIPTLVIAQDRKRITLWKPDFFPARVLTPSDKIPNIKGFRLRENRWDFFISARRVLKEAKRLFSGKKN